MGSNSNRPETSSEITGRFASEISSQNGRLSEDWQCSKGAEIRGTMGIERGNDFIKAINDASR